MQHLLQPATATGSPGAQVGASARQLAEPQRVAICCEEQKLYRSIGREAEGFSFAVQRMQDGVIGVENKNSHRAGILCLKRLEAGGFRLFCSWVPRKTSSSKRDKARKKNGDAAYV
ncbi:MAG: hypothetical protein QM776_16700 [Rhodocyclaceae bacterium]